MRKNGLIVDEAVKEDEDEEHDVFGGDGGSSS
jgi:hypothetical protein